MFCSGATSAHGTADNHLQIMVIDKRIKMNIVIDMRLLGIADADNDGYASLDELKSHSEGLRRWIEHAFDVTDSEGNAGNVLFADITSDLNIARENGDRVDHARVLQTVEFADPLRELRVDLGTLVSLVPELRVTLIDAASGLRYKLRQPGEAQLVALPNR
jgi:hypothetical protein